MGGAPPVVVPENRLALALGTHSVRHESAHTKGGEWWGGRSRTRLRRLSAWGCLGSASDMCASGAATMVRPLAHGSDVVRGPCPCRPRTWQEAHSGAGKEPYSDPVEYRWSGT